MFKRKCLKNLRHCFIKLNKDNVNVIISRFKVLTNWDNFIKNISFIITVFEIRKKSLWKTVKSTNKSEKFKNLTKRFFCKNYQFIQIKVYNVKF